MFKERGLQPVEQWYGWQHSGCKRKARKSPPHKTSVPVLAAHNAEVAAALTSEEREAAALKRREKKA